LEVKTKVWIEDDKGHVVFGGGRMKILQAVQDLGSLNKAAKALKMSYRAAWGKIKTTEERLGLKLINSQIGGGSRGGSQLTAEGLALLDKYNTLQSELRDISNKYFDDLFNH